jgi:hypothetical protein
MVDGEESGESVVTEERLPELRPWQMGWIFRDGGCVAVERHGDQAPPAVGD